MDGNFGCGAEWNRVNGWSGEHKCETEMTRQKTRTEKKKTKQKGLVEVFVHCDMMDGSPLAFMSGRYGALKYTDGNNVRHTRQKWV